jgi:GTPase KRas protein
MLESILGQAQGYLVVYSITSKPTLERVPEFIDLVKRVNDGELPPCILVGNKCDLEITREVTKAEGKAMADQFQIDWEEASAKNRINSDEIFYRVLRSTIEAVKAEQLAVTKPSKRKCVIL